MKKPVYCLPEPAFSPTISAEEASQQQNGTNDAGLWAKNTGGPSSKLHGGSQNNVGAAAKSIPS